MANTDVLLLEKVPNLGSEGDVVKVKAGYARNFLMPRGLADCVTRGNIKMVEALKKRRAEREAQERQGAEETAEKLKTISFAISVKTGKKGKLFGAVTAEDVRNRLAEEGVQLTKKELSLAQPIKELGQHKAKVKLHADLTVELSFDVVSENPIDDDSAEAEG